MAGGGGRCLLALLSCGAHFSHSSPGLPVQLQPAANAAASAALPCQLRFERAASHAQPARHLNILATTHATPAGYNHLNGYLSQPSNDIGIIVLARPASSPTARLPQLSGGGLLGGAQAASNIPAPHAKVWAAGYGQTETGESSDVLR